MSLPITTLRHLGPTTSCRKPKVSDGDIFLRIHRSTIVNLQHLKELRTEGSEGECWCAQTDQSLPSQIGSERKVRESRPGATASVDM
jgi:hypothetical protein